MYAIYIYQEYFTAGVWFIIVLNLDYSLLPLEAVLLLLSILSIVPTVIDPSSLRWFVVI